MDYGSILDGSDFSNRTMQSNNDTISDNNTLEYKSAVQSDIIDSRMYSQFRIRCSIADSDNDGVNDVVGFNDTESTYSADSFPKLVVEY